MELWIAELMAFRYTLEFNSCNFTSCDNVVYLFPCKRGMSISPKSMCLSMLCSYSLSRLFPTPINTQESSRVYLTRPI